MLYHQTKDVLYVMNFLGHKSVKNIMFYIQLEQAIFKEASDDFVTRVTRSVKGARSLVEAGFECVLEMNGLRLFRKRK